MQVIGVVVPVAVIEVGLTTTAAFAGAVVPLSVTLTLAFKVPGAEVNVKFFDVSVLLKVAVLLLTVIAIEVVAAWVVEGSAARAVADKARTRVKAKTIVDNDFFIKIFILLSKA